MKKTLQELVGWVTPLTHRQLLVWDFWLDEQWNIPDRTDGYLMQVACEVRRGNVKNPRRVKLGEFILKYRREGERPKLTKEQASQYAKAKWLGMMTRKPQVITVPPDETSHGIYRDRLEDAGS